MAHAGTPTDLAQQPATSDSWTKLLLTSIAILAIGLALAMATSFLIGNRAGGPAVDRAYDQIETQRGAWALSGVTVDTNTVEKAAAAKARAMSGVPADTSYDAVENLRALSGVTVDTNAVEKAAAAKARAMSGVPADTSYDAVENARGVAPLSGAGVDRRFDDIEARRGATTLP